MSFCVNLRVVRVVYSILCVGLWYVYSYQRGFRVAAFRKNGNAKTSTRGNGKCRFPRFFCVLTCCKSKHKQYEGTNLHFSTTQSHLKVCKCLFCFAICLFTICPMCAFSLVCFSFHNGFFILESTCIFLGILSSKDKYLFVYQ